MNKDTIKCATCNKELKGNDEVYYYTYYYDNDDYNYKPFCSFDCMIDDAPWEMGRIKDVYDTRYTIKCATCGKELKGNDLFYYTLFDDVSNYCSYKCLLKGLEWDKETVNNIYENTNNKENY